jgi:hypothetical protein
MLLIKTRLDRSAIHGIGVFAMNDIEAGAPVWEFLPDFDSKWTINQFQNFPEQAKAYVIRHGFFDNGFFFLDRDHSHFMNHANDANLVEGKTGHSTPGLVAARKISAGEELTCNCTELARNGAYHFAPDDADHFWDGTLVTNVLDQYSSDQEF